MSKDCSNGPMRKTNSDSESSSEQMKIEAISLSVGISLFVQGNFLNSSLADIPFLRLTADPSNYFTVNIFLVMILIFRLRMYYKQTH